jgi:hypothetical protein
LRFGRGLVAVAGLCVDRRSVGEVVGAAFCGRDDVVDLVGASLAADVADAVVAEHDLAGELLLA